MIKQKYDWQWSHYIARMLFEFFKKGVSVKKSRTKTPKTKLNSPNELNSAKIIRKVQALLAKDKELRNILRVFLG